MHCVRRGDNGENRKITAEERKKMDSYDSFHMKITHVS